MMDVSLLPEGPLIAVFTLATLATLAMYAPVSPLATLFAVALVGAGLYWLIFRRNTGKAASVAALKRNEPAPHAEGATTPSSYQRRGVQLEDEMVPVEVPTELSLEVRATQALALFVGFYVLAIGLALMFFAIPVAMVVVLDKGNFFILIACVTAGGTILKGVFSSPPPFQQPGPELTRDANPRLFALIDEVAAATGQQPPANVYLLPGVTAWVTTVGGYMGSGGRHVMGLGLALLAVLRPEQLRAVIAHEFGHHVGGDVKLLPFIYRTRSAIIQTMGELRDDRLLELMASAIFKGFARSFLRITHSISRQQEFAADAVAARVTGPDVVASALRETEMTALAYPAFLEGSFDSALNLGYRPPLAEGLRAYRRDPEVTARLAQHTAAQPTPTHVSVFDTHPPLRQRVAALLPHRSDARIAQFISDSQPPPHADHASDLLGDVAEAERKLAVFLLESDPPTVTWDAVAESVLIPALRRVVWFKREVLGRVRAAELPALIRSGAILDRLEIDPASPDAPAARQREAAVLIGGVLALRFLSLRGRDGYAIHFEALPALRVRFLTPGGEGFLPLYSVASLLFTGEITDDNWKAICTLLGLDTLEVPALDAPAAMPMFPASAEAASAATPALPASASATAPLAR